MFTFKDLEFNFKNKSYIIDDPEAFCKKFAELGEYVKDDKIKLDEFINNLLDDEDAVTTILDGRAVTTHRLTQIIDYIIAKMEVVVREINEKNKNR